MNTPKKPSDLFENYDTSVFKEVVITPDTEWTVEELMRDLRHLASPYAETLSDMQRTSQFILLVNRLDKALTSRDTYWKERVRGEMHRLNLDEWTNDLLGAIFPKI